MTTLSTNLSITLVLFGLAVCGGCQSLTSSTGTTETPRQHRGPEVEVVRSGVLARYDSTTVGKAFEGTFQNPTWTSFETPKGATIVQFNGTVTEAALESASLSDPGLLQNRCVESLGLKAIREHEEQAVQNEEQQYKATMQRVQDRYKSSTEAEQDVLYKERIAAIDAHDEQQKAHKKFDEEDSAKVQQCVKTTASRRWRR